MSAARSCARRSDRIFAPRCIPRQTTNRRRAGAIDLRAMLQGASALSGLHHTALGHPALFVAEYALARLWMSMGVIPGAMIGHSLGEYVAATLAGVFDLPDALTFVARRAQLIGSLPSGAMLAVPESATDLAGEMTPDVSIALVNGPKLTVVAGTDDAIAALQTRLTARAVTTRRLQVDHAFHSPMLDPLIEPLTRLAAGMALSAPAIPFVERNRRLDPARGGDRPGLSGRAQRAGGPVRGRSGHRDVRRRVRAVGGRAGTLAVNARRRVCHRRWPGALRGCVDARRLRQPLVRSRGSARRARTAVGTGRRRRPAEADASGGATHVPVRTPTRLDRPARCPYGASAGPAPLDHLWRLVLGTRMALVAGSTTLG